MTVMRALASPSAKNFNAFAPDWRVGVSVLSAALVLLAGGVTSLVALLLLAIGVMLRARNQVAIASLTFAAMVALKPLTAILIFCFALRGDGRLARWTSLLVAAVVAGALLIAWRTTSNWNEAIVALVSPSFISAGGDQSIYGLLAQRFAATPYLPTLLIAPIAALAIAFAVTGLHLWRTGLEDEEIKIAPEPAVLLLECALVLALCLSLGALSAADQALVGAAGLAAATIIGADRFAASSKLSVHWIGAIAVWGAVVAVTALKLAPSGGALALFGAGAVSAIALWRERKRAAVDVVIPKRPFGKLHSEARDYAGKQSSLSKILCSPLARGPSTNT